MMAKQRSIEQDQQSTICKSLDDPLPCHAEYAHVHCAIYVRKVCM